MYTLSSPLISLIRTVAHIRVGGLGLRFSIWGLGLRILTLPLSPKFRV